MTDLPAWLEVVVAVSTVLAGFGAAVGAIAAWKAASASLEASRDAREALALGVRPSLRVDFGTAYEGETSRTGVMLWNVGRFDATDIAVEAVRRDGRRVEGRLERLVPGTTGEHQVPAVVVVADESERHASGFDVVRSITVRYSDERRIARYETTQLFEVTTNGGITGQHTTTSERRVE